MLIFCDHHHECASDGALAHNVDVEHRSLTAGVLALLDTNYEIPYAKINTLDNYAVSY